MSWLPLFLRPIHDGGLLQMLNQDLTLLKQLLLSTLQKFFQRCLFVADDKNICKRCSTYRNQAANRANVLRSIHKIPLRTIRGLSDGRPTLRGFSNRNFIFSHWTSVNSLWYNKFDISIHLSNLLYQRIAYVFSFTCFYQQPLVNNHINLEDNYDRIISIYNMLTMRKKYETDLTDEQWEVIKPLFTRGCW